jgi:hypothetical protein
MMCRVVTQLLSGAFGCLLALGIMGAGFAMLGAPETAKRLLKNLAIAVGLFVLGSFVLNYFCAVGR